MYRSGTGSLRGGARVIEATGYPEVILADSRAEARSSGVALVAILSLLVVAALWFGGKAQLLRVALPAMAMLVAVVLHASRPILYVQYTLWVWFLTPLLRRIVDWRFEYTEPNFVLLAPFLVSGVAGLTLLRPGTRPNVRVPVAFVLCGCAIVYGFIVGMVVHPSGETVYGLVNWLCPLLFGLHLYLNWHRYSEYRAAVTRTFLWGVLILGVYGIYQFFLPPAWDTYWLENANYQAVNPSFGQPEALAIRVWSTLNAPGPFANVMMVGLLLLFITRSPLKLPGAVAGFFSFLLSGVRAAWLSWIIGFVFILKNVNPRVVARVFLSVILLLICLLPLIADPRVSSVIGDRVKTFTDLGRDESFSSRLDMYRTLAIEAIENPFGHGLSNMTMTRQGIPIDSGFLAAFFSLGWLGTLLFAIGTASLFLGRPRNLEKGDEFAGAARAIMIAMVAQLVSGNIFTGINGAVFWVFVGLNLCTSHRYKADQPGVLSAQVLNVV
jgi:hypothetical protein